MSFNNFCFSTLYEISSFSEEKIFIYLKSVFSHILFLKGKRYFLSSQNIYKLKKSHIYYHLKSLKTTHNEANEYTGKNNENNFLCK